MIAGRAGLAHGRRGVGEQPGEQDRALHLRARDRHPVLDPVQWSAVHGERGVPVARLDLRSHLHEWIDDPSHRPSSQLGIPGEDAGERLAGEDPDQEADRGSGSDAVERAVRRSEPVQSPAVHDERRRITNLDPDPEPADATKGGVGVVARQKPGDFEFSVRQRAEQKRPVGDRFIPGDAGLTAQRTGGEDAQPAHGNISFRVALISLSTARNRPSSPARTSSIRKSSWSR